MWEVPGTKLGLVPDVRLLVLQQGRFMSESHGIQYVVRLFLYSSVTSLFVIS